MKLWTLAARSAFHHRRTNLGVVLGAAVATATLVGALAVGDSVRASLRSQALARVGRVESALIAGERLFRDSLAHALSGVAAAEDAGDEPEGPEADRVFAPVLQLSGVLSAAGGARRVGDVQVLGVDARFFALAPEANSRTQPEPGTAWPNEHLARALGVEPGDAIVARVATAGGMPGDAALSESETTSVALRLRLEGAVSDAELGRFGLAASQLAPHTLFVPLAWLQEELELEGSANLLLTDARQTDAARWLAAAWRPADALLTTRATPDGALFELTSDRVFLEDAVVGAAEEAARAAGIPAAVALTYFVNGIARGDRSTPYSMVTALGSGLGPNSPVPADMAADEINVNAWLADDLGAGAGDELELTYFVLGPGGGLEERSRTFRTRAVLPLEGLAADPSWMPDFPGLADVDNCRDWEPGVPVELDRIRDEDEAYWDRYRGTPKAFVTLGTGREMWANRFGSATSVRGPIEARAAFEAAFAETLVPRDAGHFFRDVRSPALAGSSPATDFGGLFLGLSFFLIAAALLLTSLLFSLGAEQREREVATLLAVGFTRARVGTVIFLEAGALALAGGVLGCALGLGYTRAILYGLDTLWREAVGRTTIAFHAAPASVAVGLTASLAAALGTIALVARRHWRRVPARMLTEGRSAGVEPPLTSGARGVWLAVAAVGGVAAAAILLVARGSAGAGAAAGAFFGAGSSALVAALAASRLAIDRAGRSSALSSIARLGLSNVGRRPGRSLATVALLACGTFLVIAVGSNRLRADSGGGRASGTGGFALFARSTHALRADPTTEAGRDAWGLDAEDLAGVDFVPFRVAEGDDASCLNLNRPQEPTLIGVDPEDLSSRGAFSFADELEDQRAAAALPEAASPWSLLELDLGPDVVPAIADQASLTWVLHRSLGDTLEYRDETGRVFGVRIVATLASSVLQGLVVVDERLFEERFPSQSGHRLFLIDAPAARAPELSARLSRNLEDAGLVVTGAAERLDEFNAVQNTYLWIFQVLGGIGLLLGSAGLSTVVLRNTLERRGELATARATGFSRPAALWLVQSEHLALVAAGAAAGALPGLVAALPARGPEGGLGAAAAGLAWALAIAASGIFWVWVAARWALAGPLVRALRND